jgi:hypothetical protein
MKEGGTLSSGDRYRLGIIGAFVGLTFLLLPVRGDGSVEGLASQRTSPPVLTCSEASAKSVGPVAYATGKTTGASGARQGQELQADYEPPPSPPDCGPADPHCICRNRYNTCTDACYQRYTSCTKNASYEKWEKCNDEDKACNNDCLQKDKACLGGN